MKIQEAMIAIQDGVRLLRFVLATDRHGRMGRQRRRLPKKIFTVKPFKPEKGMKHVCRYRKKSNR